MTYKDPVLVKLRDLFNAYGPKELKDRYGFGDSLVVNGSSLPCAFISIDVERLKNASNAELESNIPIVVNVVYDLKRDFGASMDNIQGHMSVVGLIIGRDENYRIKSDSLAGVLWRNEQLDDKLWINLDTEMEVDFGMGIEKRGPGVYTTEGILRFTVKHHQLMPEYIN